MNLQKQKPYRSNKYLDFVRALPCCHCGNDLGSDAHHIGGLIGGMGTKNSDLTTISLCRLHHSLLHSGNLELDELFYLAKTIQQAGDSGILGVK